MSAASLPAPGSKLGPCADVVRRGRIVRAAEECGHRDCAASRQQASSPCTTCGRAIGYETRYYRDGDGYQHADCAEREDGGRSVTSPNKEKP